MKKLPLWAVVGVALVAVVVAVYSGTKSLAPPPRDPDRFPKPSPEVMEMIKKSKDSYENRDQQ